AGAFVLERGKHRVTRRRAPASAGQIRLTRRNRGYATCERTDRPCVTALVPRRSTTEMGIRASNSRSGKFHDRTARALLRQYRCCGAALLVAGTPVPLLSPRAAL